MARIESNLDSFAELQAILAGLPMHAVPASVFSRGCGPTFGGSCGGDRRQQGQVDTEACMQRLRVALQQVCVDYPKRAAELRQLSVEHANLDLVCFADHIERRLFTAVRGTDRMMNPLTTPRDINNDMLILFGMPPWRTQQALQDYCAVRDRFPSYASYGSGHSLGGNIVEHLAVYVEEDRVYQFCRIDVFNTGASPLRSASTALKTTELHAHRVPGDWASVYYKPPSHGNTYTYQPKGHLRSRHSLGHFLPEKASESSVETTSGEGGEAHDEDDNAEDEKMQQRRAAVNQAIATSFQVAETMPLWMSLMSCAGVRKGCTFTRRAEVVGRVQAPRPRLCLEDSEDGWRHCEAPGERPMGPVEELQKLSPRIRASSEPLLRPPVCRADEEDEGDPEDMLPRHFITKLSDDAEHFANLPTRLTLAAALDGALLSGELNEAVQRVASGYSLGHDSLRANLTLAAALDGALVSEDSAWLSSPARPPARCSGNDHCARLSEDADFANMATRLKLAAALDGALASGALSDALTSVVAKQQDAFDPLVAEPCY